MEKNEVIGDQLIMAQKVTLSEDRAAEGKGVAITIYKDACTGYKTCKMECHRLTTKKGMNEKESMPLSSCYQTNCQLLWKN